MKPIARPTRWLATLALLALALHAAPARAARDGDDGACRWDRTASGNLVDVQVLVEGRDAPLYFAPGRWDRRYVQAFRGRHYALAIRNRTGRRIGVLAVVDGLNVVSGERSSLRGGETMYVLDPWESVTIRGWRTSLEQVRQFVFVDEERSYAERTGQANGDLGWIRVLAFEERRPLAWLDMLGGPRREKGPDRGTCDDRPAPAQEPRAPAAELRAQGECAPQAEKSLAGGASRSESYPGTGWGERRYDPVQETSFIPASSATDRLAFRYEYASGLRALGIRLDSDRLRDRERGELGFAKPPEW